MMDPCLSSDRRPAALGRLCFVVLALVLGPSALRAEQITVFAAASTATALNEVAERYAATGVGAAREDPVRLVFAASSILAKQIVQGAPADLFLSANSAWMDYLDDRAAIDRTSRVDLLGNRLVLIAPVDRALTLTVKPGFALDAALDGGRLAIGDPAHVPAGIYAEAALRSLGVWRSIAGKTARTADVRAALALVDRGEAAAGIVYRSDVEIARHVRVAAVFPQDSHPLIVYPLAVVAGRGAPPVEHFYRYLLGPEAHAIFRDHGFDLPNRMD